MADLHNIDEAIDFYDQRYQEGYMEEWEDDKKKKVEEVISLLGLPSTGKALDFGCGNGVFTHIIKRCLPQWEVYGVEISKTAVQNASKKFPECHFFTIDQAAAHLHSFDFLFSHHVIEHVQDLKETFLTINSYLKDKSYQLHILPCGNTGSLEHKISSLKKNGINSSLENRFFFEEPGHLRRMTTDDFTRMESTIGFSLQKEFYSNQNEGAINWITKSSPRFVKKLTDHSDAINEDASEELRTLRKQLLPLTYLQFPYSKYWLVKNKWSKSFKDRVLLAVLFFPALVSKTFYDKFQNMANREWKEKKTNRNGSEMFLFYSR